MLLNRIKCNVNPLPIFSKCASIQFSVYFQNFIIFGISIKRVDWVSNSSNLYETPILIRILAGYIYFTKIALNSRQRVKRMTYGRTFRCQEEILWCILQHCRATILYTLLVKRDKWICFIEEIKCSDRYAFMTNYVLSDYYRMYLNLHCSSIRCDGMSVRFSTHKLV